MNSPTFKDVLTALCERDNRIPKKPNGQIHTTGAARVLGINQATLSRMLDGQSGAPSPANAVKICMFFDVTRDQLEGLSEVPGLFEHRHTYHFPTMVYPSSSAKAIHQNWLNFDHHIKDVLPKDDVFVGKIKNVYSDFVRGLSNEELMLFIEAIADFVSPKGALFLVDILLDRAKDGLQKIEQQTDTHDK